MDKMRQRLRETAAELGLPLGERDRTYNSRHAQELGLWAESMQKGDAFHNAVFNAYFAEGKNIGNSAILIDLAVSVGLSSEEARDVLLTRSFKTAVDRDWALSREKGVTAVPTFILKEERLVGAQPYQLLAQLVEEQGVARKR